MSDEKKNPAGKVYSRALLLSQIIETTRDFKKSDLGDGNSPLASHGFGASRAGQIYGDFEALGMFQQNHPNYEAMGFVHQAFVDVIFQNDVDTSPPEISEDSDLTDQTQSALIAKKIQREVDGVIMVYTIFGQVDLRCKVVGQTLRDVERAALKIRSWPEIASATTSVTIDDTDYDLVRKKMANLLKGKAIADGFEAFFKASNNGSSIDGDD